jgi:glyoxylase-like metal-dependent hydrolase (beta-lactamase superfamily II)
MLGHRAVPIFLVDGDRPALFDAGMAVMGPTYARQIRQVLADRQPAWCFLTHSHFDHCGSVGYLKRQFPDMQIVSSAKAADVFTRPNAVKLIAELNRFAAGMAADFGLDAAGGEFEPFAVDRVVAEGDTLRISPDVRVTVMETPGHTWDFLSYHIPAYRMLVASEAVGTPDETGYLVTDCLVDYDVHYRSMQRLSRLDVDILCLGHIYSCTGGEARRHMQASLTESRRFRSMVERLLDETEGDTAAAMKRIKAYEWDGKPGLRQPEPAYVLNLEARLNAVRRVWEKRRLIGETVPEQQVAP